MRESRAGSGLIKTGLTIFAVLALTALAAPVLAPHPPTRHIDSLGGRYLPPGTRVWELELADGRSWLVRRVERSAAGVRVERAGETVEIPADEILNLGPDGVDERHLFLLGTDRLGRDCWARILYGGRLSLAVAIAAAAIAATLGLTVGLAAGAAGGWLDAVLMRLADGLRAFPRLFLVLVLSALFDAGPLLVIAVLGGTGWMSVSRLVRAEVLRLKGQDFVLAARAAGAGPLAIAWRHLAINAMTPLVAATALRVGNVILIEAALSYLGLGIRPPHPTWGNMIYDAAPDLVEGWWVSALPGLAIILTVIAFTLIGDGLRDRWGKRGDADLRV